VGDRLVMFDAAAAAPMVLSAVMLEVLLGAQRQLQIQADYSL
jgi:hypothetical protein